MSAPTYGSWQQRVRHTQELRFLGDWAADIPFSVGLSFPWGRRKKSDSKTAQIPILRDTLQEVFRVRVICVFKAFVADMNYSGGN